MSPDDALFRLRRRARSLAKELESARAARRVFGIHPSTCERWRRQVLPDGLDILRPRERRRPRMPGATPPPVEQRVVAFA